MLRMYLVLFLLFITSGCYAQVGKAVMPGESKLNKNADPYSWDFGTAKEGVVLKHSFIFKNDSNKTINIKDITTSCGCAVSQVKKKILLSGEDTLVEVQFNTKGYSGTTQQFIYVHTDNLDNPIIRFIIKAEVVK